MLYLFGTQLMLMDTAGVSPLLAGSPDNGGKMPSGGGRPEALRSAAIEDGVDSIPPLRP